MNTKLSLLPGPLFAVLISIVAPYSHAASSRGLVAHEWGTFTSVQSSDGTLLSWRPLETSALPHFVYDWQHPGLNRRAMGFLFLGKGGMETLQRMETPVIYFYSDTHQTVDVQVDFPQGMITEWYPQAAQIGPATAPPPSYVATMDRVAHGAGVNPTFTFASFVENHCLTNSGIRWNGIEVEPVGHKINPRIGESIPYDRSGSHYFAARETDAGLLRASSLCPTNLQAQYEKFLFYRGVGNFATGLRVTMDANGTLTVVNTGEETLGNLLVLELRHGAGHFEVVNRLNPGAQQSMNIGSSGTLMKPELTKEIGQCMARTLEEAGLYRREAQAMVKTWQDSWFAEDGVRVLYLLPRAWTDRTLPMKMQPAPSELVRVMVGRAEVITPDMQRSLANAITGASQGDTKARGDAVAQLKKLGRFALPALQLATQGAKPETATTGWTLLQSASPARTQAAFN